MQVGVMKQTKLTIADIARKGGVSKATVSRVLNNRPYVEKATRNKVLAIIEETGFVPHHSATSLAGGKTNILGLLVPSLANPYSLTVIQGVAEKVAGKNLDLMLYTTGLSEKNQKKFLERLSKNAVDGLIVLLPRESTNFESELFSSDLPLVLIDHRSINADLPSIAVTNEKGGFDATEYLISLGHTKIGFIAGLLAFGCSVERLDGYKKGLEKYNLPFCEEYVVEGDFTEASGYRGAKELMLLPTPPTALFCSNDDMAIGAMQALEEMGKRIPGDVSIIGFDDSPRATLAFPRLTTIRQPLYQMGESAANLVVDLINGKSVAKKCIVLKTELIVRDSCAELSKVKK